MSRVPQLFDRLHPGESWDAWRAFIRAVYGLPLDGPQLAVFRARTGLDAPRPGGYRTVLALVGVRSGKTSTGGVVLAGEALDAGRGSVALAVAQDQRASVRVVLDAARAPFEARAMRQRVSRETGDTLELASGARVVAYPCSSEAIRGLTAQCVLLDEVCHFRNRDGRPAAEQVLRVARTRTLTTGGRVFLFSSPGPASGAVWEMWRRGWGVDSDVLVWQGSAKDMNPTLREEDLASIRAADPVGSVAELDGRFMAGVSQLFDDDALDAVVDRGVRQRPYDEARRYHAFVDVSSGSGGDAFALAVAHREGDVAVLDCLRAWAPPFSPTDVLAEVGEVLAQYRLRQVTGDRYAAGLQTDFFKRAGIAKKDSTRDRSALYAALLPLVNAGRVRLLDRDDLLRELRTLERRPGATKDRIDAPRGAHEDQANAAAGALTLAVEGPTIRQNIAWIDGVFVNRGSTGVDRDGVEWQSGNPVSGTVREGRYLVVYRDGRKCDEHGRTLFLKVFIKGRPRGAGDTPHLSIPRRDFDPAVHELFPGEE